MVDRILITPTRVAISKPGYDVKTAPVSTDYLAVDSSFGMPLRVLLAGVRFGISIISFTNSPVNYGTTYSIIPKVLCLPFDPNSGYSVVNNLFQKWTNGVQHQDLFFQPYNVQMEKSRFYLSRSDGNEGVHDETYYATARNWLYIVFPP